MTRFLKTDYEQGDYDLASEKRFDYEEKQEAVDYMMQLATKHGLEYTTDDRRPRRLLD